MEVLEAPEELGMRFNKCIPLSGVAEAHGHLRLLPSRLQPGYPVGFLAVIQDTAHATPGGTVSCTLSIPRGSGNPPRGRLWVLRATRGRGSVRFPGDCGQTFARRSLVCRGRDTARCLLSVGVRQSGWINADPHAATRMLDLREAILHDVPLFLLESLPKGECIHTYQAVALFAHLIVVVLPL